MGQREKELDFLLGLDAAPPQPSKRRTETDRLRADLAAIGDKYRDKRARRGADKAVDAELGLSSAVQESDPFGSQIPPEQPPRSN
jgi:hypothetical protein